MSTSLPSPVAPTVTPEQLDLIRRTVAKDATPDELKLYLYDCARQGVHPLDGLLYFSKRGGKYRPITAIDFMRIRASETGEYAGNDDYVFTGEPKTGDFKAVAQVWRLVQGQRVPFTRTARWNEYVPPAGQDFKWKQMPHVMLGKCAEAQALRAGFPRQLAGLYAKEEMDQAGPEKNGYTVEFPATTVNGSGSTDLKPQHGGVFIARVDVTDTRNANVKRYLVTDSNGEQFITIKTKLGELCAHLAQEEPKPEVKITAKASNYGNDLVSVTRISADKPLEAGDVFGSLGPTRPMREPGDEEGVF